VEPVIERVIPFVLILGRVSAFFAVLPLWSFRGIPMHIRAAVALIVSVVFAVLLPPQAGVVPGHWLAAVLVMVREVLCGLALGLAVALVFAAIRQTGEILQIQMGLADAEIIDPLSGNESDPVALLFEMAFLVLFLAAGGHHLLLAMIMRSYEAFPIGHAPTAAVMADSVLQAGSLMLMFGLKLAAPLLAGFLLLSVTLAVLARALPEMNILLASLPLRVGLGFILAAALVPALGDFTGELAGWLNRFMPAAGV
jgi:flagellar biosynthetic protein FliR